MRGKAFGKICNNLFNRITPAYAGKRLIMYIMCGQIRDHPRLCGEKLSRKKVAGSGAGSPPPMRGKVILLNLLKICFRITPAYAGKSATK